MISFMSVIILNLKMVRDALSMRRMFPIIQKLKYFCQIDFDSYNALSSAGLIFSKPEVPSFQQKLFTDEEQPISPIG